MRTLGAIVAVLATALAAAAPPASASWGRSDGGQAASAARQLGTVGKPATSVNGRSVTLSWTAPGGGAPPGGYTVERYVGSTGTGAGGSCAGTVGGLSCTDSPVDGGTYSYEVRPVRASWSGPQSAPSDAVTVAAPALTLDATSVNGFPTTLTGQLSDFLGGQTVSYRLDDPASGPVLSGATMPATVPASGGADVSVSIPAGTANGPHTVYAIGSGGDQAARGITVAAPEVTGSVIAKTAGGRAGVIRPRGRYYVYANVSGSPPAGLATLTADVSAITSGADDIALSDGAWTVAGQPYNYRSARQTAGASISAGAKPYSLTLIDSGGTQTTTNHSVTVDRTKPTAVDVETTNVATGTTGRAETGDTLVLTFSEPIEETSLLAARDGSATDVVVRLNNSATDTVRVYNATNTAALPLGTVDLNADDYTSANRTFGLTGIPSTMASSGVTVTITLGTASGAVTTAALPTAMVWTLPTTATDAAGNRAAATAATESGAADPSF